MKNPKRLIIAACLLVLASAGLFAQTSSGTAKGISTTGLTGIIVTPSARIGWESRDVGIDGHYSFLYDPMTHVGSVTVSFLKAAEVAGAFEIDNENDLNNIFISGKYQVYKSGGAFLAAGADYEYWARDGVDDDLRHSSSIFFIATYSGEFFNMPAVTSLLLGWQFYEFGDFDSKFNFSMGFEMSLFPDTFKNYVFWISDFGNYSYVQAYASGINANHRGTFNTGLRFDILKVSNMKLQIDVVGTDLLDEDRGLMGSVTFGYGF